MSPLRLSGNSLQWRHFIQVTGLLAGFYKFLKTWCHILFGECLEKVSKKFKESVFSRVLLKQFEQSNLLPITTLKTDSTANVSCEFSNFPKLLGECLWRNSFLVKQQEKFRHSKTLQRSPSLTLVCSEK